MERLSDYFPLTRVINLPERTDRYREISAQLEALGIPFTPGIVELFPAIRPAEVAGFPNACAHGCFLSHLEILRDARARGMKSVLIMEDDLQVLKQDADSLIDLAEELVKQPWSIAYFGHFKGSKAAGGPRWLSFQGELRSSHFYAVHSGLFDRLITYLENCLATEPGDRVGGPMEYDGALNMFRLWRPDAITLIAQPSLGSQRSSRSDIHPRDGMKSLSGVREAVGLLRLVRKTLNAD